MHILSKSWLSLPANKKAEFQSHLREQHHLFITDNHVLLTNITSSYPFIPRLEKALLHHTGQTISIKQGVEEELCFWVIMPQTDGQIKIGFLHERLGPHPSKAIAGIIAAGCFLIFITTIFLVRRITQPITTLSNAVNLLSSGKLTTQIPETGAEELVMMARSFNKMTREITQLISNRSILFGGISHDLRTPITRMQIALELIEDTNNSFLVAGMQKDLKEMESLIKQSLELVKGMNKYHALYIGIKDVINEIIFNYRRQNLIIDWKSSTCGKCLIEVNALRRVICNLLDNAFYYSNQKTVTLSCSKVKNKLIIRLFDQGPGIPPDKLEAVFQPFYRLDNSRSKKTGGSGLGLAIVQHLCDIHNWKIQLFTNKDGGLEARLTIPVVSHEVVQCQ